MPVCISEFRLWENFSKIIYFIDDKVRVFSVCLANIRSSKGGMGWAKVGYTCARGAGTTSVEGMNIGSAIECIPLWSWVHFLGFSQDQQQR